MPADMGLCFLACNLIKALFAWLHSYIILKNYLVVVGCFHELISACLLGSADPDQTDPRGTV